MASHQIKFILLVSYSSSNLHVQHKICEEKNIGMYTLQMEAAPVVVSPFVQCELVTPRWFPTSKSSCSVGVNGFIGSGFICFAVWSCVGLG